jgi:hypothetical protein
MRMMLGALAIAGGVALISCEAAQAMSDAGTAMKHAAPAASTLQLARLMSDRIHHARSDAETARQMSRQHHHHHQKRKGGTSHH